MSPEELDAIKQYLDSHLAKAFIKASLASYSLPVLFVKKLGGEIQFCVDYRRLNTITKKDRYPIPLIEEILAQLEGAKYFTKIDIRQAFYRIRMSKDSKELTTFLTRFGTFKYLVMPFGLCNGPASWQHLINDTLFDLLHRFVQAYLDNIFIYSKTIQDHRSHVCQVLLRLREAGLQADIDKCEFHVQETKFLGLIVSTEGIQMDPQKVSTILDWARPTSLRHVRSFLGFCNFYRRFIRDFSKLAKPLTGLTKKDTPFDWTSACQSAFDNLKKMVTEAPILAHYKQGLSTIVETDSSDYLSSGVFSQLGKDGLLHPVAFFSKNLNLAECNYEIYDKELLAIIRCFEQWRPELEATGIPIKVITDHKSLEYFMTTKKLSRRQARWAEFLSGFNFVISYTPGRENGKANLLTRRPNDCPMDDQDD